MCPRFLLIDDSKGVHGYLKDLLKDQKVELMHAYNGQEGIDVLKNSTKRIDLIFLDWEMPVLSGIEALPRLKAVNPNVPVIMMTSKNSFEDIRQALSLGADEYIMKPFDLDIVLDKLDLVGIRRAG